MKTPATFLLIAKKNPALVKGITLDGSSETMTPIVQNIKKPTAIDFDVKSRSVFISDTEQHTIQRVAIQDKKAEIILKNGIEMVGGVAFDWIARNLYWTDEEKRTINVVNLSNTTLKKTLIQSDDIRPTTLAINPKYGYMYWSHKNWTREGKGYIERAWMDGSNREKFLTENISWATGLALDIIGKRLYWSDGNQNIVESVDLSGGDRRIEIQHISRPVGLAFFNGSLYVMEHTLGNIIQFNLATKKLTTLNEGNYPLYQLKVYDTKSQIGMCTT